MHLLEKPIDYSKTDDFHKEVNKLSLEDAKILVKKLYEDNRTYKQLAARAAITVEQYKHLLAVFDGYSGDKENISEVGNNLRKILVGTFDASRNLSFWLKLLCEASKHIVFEDASTADVFSLVGNVCCEIYTTSCEFKAHKILLPEEPKGVYVRNLERTEEENIEDPPRGFYSHQSKLINRRKKKTNVFQKNGKRRHRQRGKSVADDKTSSFHDDDARSSEESDNSLLKQSESTCENDYSEGGENRCDEGTHEKRKAKRFGISYPKSQNLFQHDLLESKKIYSNISAECDESEHSATKSDNDINEDSQSLSENEGIQDVDTFSDLISSKSPSKYKRKHYVNIQEGSVKKRGRKKRKSSTSRNSGTLAKKPRRYRRSQDSNTLENYDDVKDVDEGETLIHKNSISSSKRYQRSKMVDTSDIHEIDLSDRKKGQKLKKHDSETEAEAEISLVKPKRNRRGRRRKKINMTLEQEINNFKLSHKGEGVSFESVPCVSNDVVKCAYVYLTDVLDDPEVQHYTDVIQYKERMENECASSSRWKERIETEETASNKERNDMEALQEWNVLDAVSDEEDKEFDNTEDGEEMPSNDNHQASDSDVEQETVNEDDKEHLEIDSDGELDYCSDVEHDENCPSKMANRNRDVSDSEFKEHRKGPSTPDASPHESEYEDNSDVQDENDGDADSVRSNGGEDISPRSPTPGSPIYGKKGPRTPPSPAPFEPLRRGPQTPPGNGPDSEGSKELEASSPQSDESEVIAVMDDEECCSDCSTD